jgi:hypothetical protein
MPPSVCPERLQKLIDRLNRESSPEAREETRVLRLILQAIRDKRQNNKGPETYVVNLPSKITINLTNYESDIRSELAEALADIEPPERIERVRECVVGLPVRKGGTGTQCNRLFWAGRAKTLACDKHVDLWRQREYRRREKISKTKAATKRRKELATNTFDQMNRTEQSVIRAIMLQRARQFSTIDQESWMDFYHDDLLPRSTWIVRNVTHSMFKNGFLTYYESADKKDRRGFSPFDRYYPTPKLDELWEEMTARAL